jgi:hypothetical protein
MSQKPPSHRDVKCPTCDKHMRYSSLAKHIQRIHKITPVVNASTLVAGPRGQAVNLPPQPPAGQATLHSFLSSTSGNASTRTVRTPTVASTSTVPNINNEDLLRGIRGLLETALSPINAALCQDHRDARHLRTVLSDLPTQLCKAVLEQQQQQHTETNARTATFSLPFSA